MVTEKAKPKYARFFAALVNFRDSYIFAIGGKVDEKRYFYYDEEVSQSVEVYNIS